MQYIEIRLVIRETAERFSKVKALNFEPVPFHLHCNSVWSISSLSPIFLKILIFRFYFICNSSFLACMFLYHMHACHQRRSEESTVSSRTGVTDDFEPSSWSWELSPGPLEAQPAFLTLEPFLQHVSYSYRYTTI